MAIEFYVEQADRSPKSGIANEDVYAGELVHDDGDGVDVLTFAAVDEDASGHLGLARYDAQAFAREHEDEVREDKYVASDEQRNRVQYQEFESDARVRIRTPEDNGTDGAPSISHGDVVGVVDAAGGTVASADEYQGRVVQEGYTDSAGTPTTYSRANSNFVALGVAYRPGRRQGDALDEYDYPVRVSLFGDVKESE